MKKSWKIILFASAITPIAISSIVPAEAKPQIAGMTNAQQAALKTSKMAIVLPGYVPSGFQVVKVVVEPCSRKDCRGLGGPSYSVTYRSPRNTCFYIAGTSGGIGDVWGEYKVPVTSKLLGQTTLYFDTRPGNLSSELTPSLALLQVPQDRLITQWASIPSSSGYYHLVSVRSDYGCTTGITPLEAIQIFESLEWLPYTTSISTRSSGLTYQGYCTFLSANNQGDIVNDNCTIYDDKSGIYHLKWSDGVRTTIVVKPNVEIDGVPASIVRRSSTGLTVIAPKGNTGFCWNCRL